MSIASDVTGRGSAGVWECKSERASASLQPDSIGIGWFFPSILESEWSTKPMIKDSLASKFIANVETFWF